MYASSFLLHFTILTGLCTKSVWGSTAEVVDMLKRDLTRDYNTHIRPIKNHSQTVQVGIRLYLMFIHDLDEKEQELTFSAWAYMEWYDEFLRWNESEYSGISSLLFPPADVWKPDLAVSNSFERMTKFTTGNYLIRVRSDGTVEWAPGDIFKTHCTVDITYYPFDIQSCDIIFGTWMYVIEEVDVYPMANISLVDYQESGEWEIVGLESDRTMETYDCCPDEDTVSVKFIVRISRRKTFYILTVILPVLMFSFLNVVDFVLPPNSGEKMSLSVTVFLSFAFFMSILNESMPRTSMSLSILGIYMIMVMAMGTLSVVLSAIVIMLYHKENPDLHQILPVYSKRLRVQRVLAQTATSVLPDIGDRIRYEINGTVRKNSVSERDSEQKMSFDKNGPGINKVNMMSIARRCDRIFLWFSLTFSVASSTAILVILTQQ